VETEEALGNMCLTIALDVTGSRIGFIAVIDDDGVLHDIACSNMSVNHCVMYDQAARRRPSVNFVPSGLFDRVLEESRSVISNDLTSRTDRDGLPFDHSPLTTLLGVPLLQNGKVIGLLAVANREEGYHRKQQDDLEAVASVVNLALQIKKTELDRERTQEELANTKEQLENTLNRITDGYYALDSEWRFFAANRKAEDHFGKPADELLGRNIWELTRTSPESFFYQKFHEAKVKRLPVHFEAQSLIRPAFWAELHLYPRGENLEVYFSDISQRKRAEDALLRSEKLYSKAFHSAPMGIIISRFSDGYYINVNEAFEEITGYSQQEAVGKSALSLNLWGNPDDRHRAVSALSVTGHIGNYEFPLRRKDNQIRSVAASFELIDLNGEACVISIFQDITARKQAEEALRESNRSKDEFLAMLAHELRNPLAAIRSAVHILGLDGLEPDNLHRKVEVIDRQVTHMARLLDDLLDISRITRGRITLQKQPLLLANVLRQVVETVLPLLEARRLALTQMLTPDTLCVEGDRDRLVQVFGNLLNNAIKFTPENGHIWLDLFREDRTAVVRVRDNGRGIAPELLPRLFDLFVQGEPSTGAQSGLGIGLTMVKTLVGMHGGSVVAASGGLGRGSEFSVRLPVIEAACIQRADCAPSPKKAPKLSRRVLVVDDVADTAVNLAEVLASWGCRTHTALDGPSALEAAEQFAPDAVLLDIGMPGMDGYEVARRLLRDSSEKKPLLVAITGYGQEHDRRKSFEAGFDAHLIKPVNLDELWKVLKG